MILFPFCAAVDLADEYLKYPSLEPQVVEPEVRAKFKILLYEYQTMFEQSSSLVWADNFLAESHTCDSPEQDSQCRFTQQVVFDERFDPEMGIRVFLVDGFAKICVKNSMSHVEQPWPGGGIIDLLVQRSLGQFIYASTVLKFVGADFCSPAKQLALILKSDPTAFSDLDQLYTQILLVYPSTADIVQILGTILAFDGDLEIEVIEDILGMEEGGLKLVLSGLSSLMEDDKTGEHLDQWFTSCHGVIPHFAHSSFRDYLFDSRRSGPFHVNVKEYDNQITTRSFALIIQLIRSWR